MKRVLVVLSVILLGGISMVWGGQPPSCTPSGGVTARVVSTHERGNYITIELTNYSQSQFTVHGEVTCNGKLDGRFVETAQPSDDGKNAKVTKFTYYPTEKVQSTGDEGYTNDARHGTFDTRYRALPTRQEVCK